jgi:hypothetical protein
MGNEMQEALGIVGFTALLTSPIWIPVALIALVAWISGDIRDALSGPVSRDPYGRRTEGCAPYDAGASRIPKAGPGNPWGL